MKRVIKKSVEVRRWNNFFFQAEDGTRDGRVTGVQTCALPISSCFAVLTLAKLISQSSSRFRPPNPNGGIARNTGSWRSQECRLVNGTCLLLVYGWRSPRRWRSEERRVGKECRARGTAAD